MTDDEIDWPERAFLPGEPGRFELMDSGPLDLGLPSKEELFQSMPDIRVGNNDGSEMQWKCIDNVWHWKHVAADGTMLAEGEGSP